ncbi:MAG: glutamate synthase [Myxococcales bacterium]|nr:glutamate synthase [Myxococcales bacterium]
MSELVPMPLSHLARRALAEHARQGAVFDLPESKWHTGGANSTAVRFHGEAASTPLGPAAGPQSQLAQNIVLSWLGGSRILELKTVQVMDELVLPRPCIDATNVGYNVEWSQELKVEQSLEEYVKAAMLIRILTESGVARTVHDAAPHLLFDMSVGYDLAGIRSDKVSAFLRGMKDTRRVVERLRGELTRELARYRDIEVDSRLSDCVTLSTFHGCPAVEIESICTHLLRDVGVHVIVKLNPTLLGYRDVCGILHDRLGFTEIRPIESEFQRDLQWDQALGMMSRLGKIAHSEGLTLGAKFTNTLVVENHRPYFPKSEERMYMSGQPLYPISLSLALRFREVVGAAFPISFSAGIDAQNFPDAVLCGLAPITTCTDLLRPGGYGRLYKYLGNLDKKMTALGATDIDSFILAAEGASAAGISDVREASLFNMRRVVQRTLAEPRYTKAKNAAIPRKIGSQLVLFDCISCDKCIPVCPNDANFVFHVEPVNGFSEEAYLRPDGSVAHRLGMPFVIEQPTQIGNYADFCNDCGNCDVFCPEDGGPFIEKPRFFGSLASFERHKQHGGFYLEASAELARVWACIGGRDYRLDLDVQSGRAVFGDGLLELTLAPESAVIESARSSLAGAVPEGHVLSTSAAKSILAIVRGVLALDRPNPVNAPLL